MMSFVAAAVACGLLGAVVHECVHWTVWRVCGRDPEVDWRRLNVLPTAGPDTVRRSDRIAAIAPVLVGLAVLPAVVAIGLLPVWVGWVTLTLTGALGDWQMALA
jgi:membrane-associated protease RseP (regulator of RpoE activity)